MRQSVGQFFAVQVLHQDRTAGEIHPLSYQVTQQIYHKQNKDQDQSLDKQSYLRYMNYTKYSEQEHIIFFDKNIGRLL